jgi:subtilisin family serine protease
MDCNGHGSHCAGIVAAGENPYGFVGVAPQATLGAYRIFGCTGSAANDVVSRALVSSLALPLLNLELTPLPLCPKIIPAMIRAAEDGADVISMSIGGPAGWTEDVLSVLAQRLVESGIVVSISQGNSGDEGPT